VIEQVDEPVRRIEVDTAVAWRAGVAKCSVRQRARSAAGPDPCVSALPSASRLNVSVTRYPDVTGLT
jgi:hypothetical protein